MDGQVRRATWLGAAGSVVSGGAAAGLLHATVTSWTGWGTQEVAAGLGLIATGAAAGASAWISLLLAGATVVLLRGTVRADAHVLAPAHPSLAPHRLVRRVVAGLLVLGALGAAPVAAGAVEPVPLAAGAVEPAPLSRPSNLPDRSPGSGHPTLPDLPALPESPERSPSGLQLPEPGWTPTVPRPTPRPSAEVGLVSTSADEPLDRVVVRRGDTLWGIAARHLGQHATDQDVAQEWPRWYAANRAVIGDDPDLILPGQELLAPSTGGGR